MKALFLVSGGIDSPIAAYLGIRRGWIPTFLYFDGYPFFPEKSKSTAMKKIEQIMKITGVVGRIIIVPHSKDLKIILEKCKRNLTCLLCKRMMYRKAGAVAKLYECDVIVTGEMIGEQASQTVRNLTINDRVIDVPIIRPLLGLNKVEVEAMANKMGIQEVLSDSCKAAAIKARTRAKEEELEEEERKIPINELLEESIRAMEIL